VSALRWIAYGFAVVAASMACADTNPHVVAQFAANFAPAGRSVSVFGVFKDGRMSSSHWSMLSTRLAAGIGGEACENGFDTLTSSAPATADAIAHYAMAEGPDDTLLAKVAPSASGDLVLVLGIAGQLQAPAAHNAQAGAPSASTSIASSPRMSGHGGHRAPYATMGNTPRRETTQEADTLDLTASFYSVKAMGFVALIQLKYAGTDVDEALKEFALLLSQKLPQLHCVGWAWDANLQAADFAVHEPAATTPDP
jgi:hypothetical protein